MKTPIVDFVKKYSKSHTVRLHMPGHKGKKFLGLEKLDITEINGADVLNNAGGIIKESQQNAATLFDSAATYYSAQGSTTVIKAMLALALENCGPNPSVLAGRNAHKAFIYACALLDVNVSWLFGDSGNICECNITPEYLENYLKNTKTLPNAVYVTSPDYLGNMLNIKGLAQICKNYNIPLVVDNAHGAYLRFLKDAQHPINLGAAMCCDSAHKTLPVLTGGAYLHIAKGYEHYVASAEKYLALFSSTSPSYLVLQSLDFANKYLGGEYKNQLQKCVQKVHNLKGFLRQKGYKLIGTEPLKITVNIAEIGYTADEFYNKLKCCKIEPELCSDNIAVFMFTPQNNGLNFIKLKSFFGRLEHKNPINNQPLGSNISQQKLSIRKAMLSSSESVLALKAEGRVLASPTVSCPPAVPILISGELVTKQAIQLFKRYNIEKIDVVKDN
ncbi:MAG: amino acid decarboxylase [Clostridia bacterium]|nr:amino acid decarboxylase [Clostridia bacterium]